MELMQRCNVQGALDKNGLMWVLEAGSGRLLPTRKIASHWKFPQQQNEETSKQKKKQPRWGLSGVGALVEERVARVMLDAH